MKLVKLGLKILLGLIIFLVILALVGYLALTHWINPNSFKPQIIQTVEQATGRTVTLDGNLAWSFYPNLGIEINNAALGNPKGFAQPTFATIDSANLLLRWHALLERRIQISHLVLNGLQIHLITDGAKNNWTFPSTAPSSPANTKAEEQQMSFMLEEIELNNGSIIYDDNRTKVHYALTNLNISSPNFTLVAPMEVKASGDLMSDDLAGGFKIDSLFINMKSENEFEFNKLALNSHFNYVSNNNQNIPIILDLSGNVILNTKTSTVNLSGVKFSLNQVLSGNLNAKIQNFKAPHYSGNLTLPTFSLENVLSIFNKSLPDIPNKNQFANTSLKTNFAGTKNALSLSDLKLGFGNTIITGTLNLSSFSPFKLNENLAINQIDLADFTDLKGARLPMQDLTLQGALSVDSFDAQDMPSSLNASQNILVKYITIKGFDLGTVLNNLDIIVNNIVNLKKVSDAYSQIQSQLSAIENVGAIDASNGKETDFGSLVAHVVIKDGVVTTPTLTLSGPLVKVTGNGKIDLNKLTVNYQLNSQVIASSRNIVKTLVIPYNLNGPFSNIQQGVDWSSVNGQVVGFITSQIGRTVTSVVSTVVSAPVEAVGGVAKGVAGALSHIFGGTKASQS